MMAPLESAPWPRTDLQRITDGGKHDMSRTLRIGGIILLAVILIGAAVLLVRRAGPPVVAETAPTTVTVAWGNIEETVSATGNVVAERQATLAFASNGEIAEVLVEEGQAVEAGQVLARLDTESLEWQVTRSQASLDTAEARLEQAQEPASEEDLASAQAALDNAIANYEEVEAGPSAQDLASAQAALDSAIANYNQVKAGPTEADLASARATLESARASLQQAQAAYDRIKDRPDAAMRQESLNLQNATIEVERAQANYDAAANHPTGSELASAAAQVAQAEATLAAQQERPTESELASAAAQVAQAQASLAQLLERPKPEDVAVYQAQVDEAAVALAQAQSELKDAALVAPFDGTILTVQVQAGEWATPGAPAIVLAATESLVLAVNVDEVDVAQLADGQMAYLSFDAIKGEQVTGSVTRIAPSSTNVSGAVAYAVEVSFAPGKLPVRLGMTANVDMVVASAKDALLVPNRAIEADREAGRYYVQRQNAGGSVERLEVQIGLRTESQMQILDGLEEGDRLVLPEVPEQGEDFSGPGMFGGMRAGGGQ
jgi:HlyD family secretion protein